MCPWWQRRDARLLFSDGGARTQLHTSLGNPVTARTEGTRPDQVPPALTGASCVSRSHFSRESGPSEGCYSLTAVRAGSSDRHGTGTW